MRFRDWRNIRLVSGLRAAQRWSCVCVLQGQHHRNLYAAFGQQIPIIEVANSKNI